MDISTNVLIDCNKFDYELIRKTRFKTNQYYKGKTMIPKTKDIFVYEYNVKYKEPKNEGENNDKKE